RKKMRDSLGIETLEIGHTMDTALKIRGVLGQNGIVAMLLDRHLGRDRVDVTMFGRTTGFLRTPAMIALLAGTPKLPCFLERREDDRFVGLCGDPLWVDASLPPDQAVQRATQAFATQLEARIALRPHLWYQFY